MAIPSWYLMRDAYSDSVLYGGFLLLGPVFDVQATPDVVRFEDGRWFIYTSATRPDGSPDRFALPINQIHPNLILFFVLLFVTPLKLLKRRWKLIALAVVLLVFSHWVVFALNVTYSMGSVFYGRGWEFGVEPGTVRLCGYLARLHSTVLFPVVPIVALLPLWFGRDRGRASRSARRPLRAAGKSGKIGPNAPCPCGSGRKYKRCCGAL